MGYDPATFDLQAESLEFELELTRRRMTDFTKEVARLEAEKARHEREVADWQAFVDRELAGLQ